MVRWSQYGAGSWRGKKTRDALRSRSCTAGLRFVRLQFCAWGQVVHIHIVRIRVLPHPHILRQAEINRLPAAI